MNALKWKRIGQRVLTVLLSASLMAGLAIPVWADEAENEQNISENEVQTLANDTGSAQDVYYKLTTENSTTILRLASENYASIDSEYAKVDMDDEDPPWYFVLSGGQAINQVIVVDDIYPEKTAHWFHDTEGRGIGKNLVEGLDNLHTDYTTDMSYMFYNCDITNYVTFIESMDVSSCEYMDYMFNNTGNISSTVLSLDLSGWNLSNIKTMAYIFNNQNELTEIILPETSFTPTDTSYMFYYCTNLTSIKNLDQLNMENNTNMLGMFANCSSLEQIDISSWKYNENVNVKRLFSSCNSLSQISINMPSDGFIEFPETNDGCWYREDTCKGFSYNNIECGEYTYYSESKIPHTYSNDSVKIAEGSLSGEDADGHYTECTIEATCSVCNETMEASAPVQYIDGSKATCTVPGEAVYRATFEYNGTEYKPDITVETEAATGHHYEFSEFKVDPSWDEWAENWTEESNNNLPTVTAVFECTEGDDSEKITVDIQIDKTMSQDPTCTEPGTIVVTGTAEYDGITEPYKETITIEATGEHEYEFDGFYVDGTLTWEEWTENWSESSKDQENLPTIKAKFICSECGETKDVDTDIYVDEELSIDPTCTTSGTMIIKGIAKLDDIEENYNNEIEIGALGHQISVTFTWNDDGTECTAAIICSRGDVNETVDCELDETEYIPATCTDNGSHTVQASVTYDGETYTDSKTFDIPATGHTWDLSDPSWNWNESSDGAVTCPDVIFECENCDATISVETSDVELITVEPATCISTGINIYEATATFKDTTLTDTYTQITPTTDHNWDLTGPTWNWDTNDDGTVISADATFKCFVCGETTTIASSNIEISETVSPTCTDVGYNIYEAAVEFENETFTDAYTQKLSALGHSINIAFSWNDDGTECIATIVCLRGDVDETDYCALEQIAYDAPTCAESGSYTMRASITFDGTQYYDDMEFSIPATGHDWNYDDPISFDYITKAKEGIVIITFECKNCSATTTGEYEFEYEVQYTYNSTTKEYEISMVTYSVKVYDPETEMTYTFWSEGDAEQMFSDHTWVKDTLGYAKPTCTVDGYQVWYCSDPGCSATMTEIEKATGHDWNMNTYSAYNENGVQHTWSSNYQACTFMFTCNNCGAHVTVDGSVTSSTSDGNTKYTATCTFNNKLVQTSVTVNALGQTISGDLGGTSSNSGNSSTGTDSGTTATGVTYNGSLGNTTVGATNASTDAKAQTDENESNDTATNNTNSTTNNSTAGNGTATNTTMGTTETGTQASETGDVKTGENNLTEAIMGLICALAVALVAVRKHKENETA